MPSWNRTPGQQTKICDSDKWNQWLILWNTPWSIQRWRNSQNLVRNRNRSQEENIHWAWLLINVLQCNYAILFPEYLNWFRYLKLEVCGCSADGDYSYEIKRCLLLGRKAMTNLDSILKSRDITLLTKVRPSSQSYGFFSSHVWMWELKYKESWVPKNWCFWTVVLDKTLVSPLDCKEIQPVHPKGISPDCSLEGLMLKLKLQYFSHLMRRAEQTLMLGKIEGERRGQQRMRWFGWHHRLNGHEFE